jgi:alpha-amylase
MVVFRKATAGTALVGFQTINADNNRIAFAREGAGFVAISRSGIGITFNASTTLPSGNYCNVAQDRYTAAVAGGAAATCSGTPVGVAGGAALITLPAQGAVILHVGAKL